MARWPYSDPAWPIVRRTTLQRDGFACQVRLPGCTTVATAADHVVALEHGGAPFDLSNLRAICTQCNSARRNYMRKGLAPGAPPPPLVVHEP